MAGVLGASFVTDIVSDMALYRDLVRLAHPASTKVWNAARYREMARHCGGKSFQAS